MHDAKSKKKCLVGLLVQKLVKGEHPFNAEVSEVVAIDVVEIVIEVYQH